MKITNKFFSKIFIILTAILLLITVCSLTKADCIDITFSKTDFLSLETAQVEINSMADYGLKTTDLFLLKEDTQQSTQFYLVNLSSKQYFLFFDVPKNPGEYQLKIKAVCNGQYQFFTKNIQVNEPIENFYESVKTGIKDNLYGIPLEQLILAGKIFSYDSVFYDKIATAYLSRPDSCLKNSCETKLIALSMVSFPQIKEELIQKLLINEKIRIQNDSNNSNITFSCFGKFANSTCDGNSTVFALFALKENNLPDNGTILWLNSQNLGIEEKAIIAYSVGDSVLANQIISLQSQSGWLPVSSSNYKESILATSKTLFALNKLNQNTNSSNLFSDSIKKAEDYLRNKFYNQNILVRESILFFGFNKDKIEPIMGVWPAIIETKSRGTFDLILKNNAQNDVNVTVSLLGSNLDYVVMGKTLKKITFSMPFVGNPDTAIVKENLEIKYSPRISNYEKAYKIPLLIQAEKSSSNITSGNVNSSSNNINETQIPDYLDYNQTGIDTSLISKDFSFIETEIKQNFSSIDPKKTIIINLKNNFKDEIKNIYLTQSSSLITLIPIIDPSSISSLQAGKSVNVTITIDPSSAFMTKQYSGEIIAKGTLNGQSTETRIPVIIGISIENNLKKCSEMKGQECGTEEMCSGNLTTATDTVSCCLAECKSKSGNINQTIGFIIIGVLIIVLFLVFMWLKKRKKKENAPFLEEAQKQYEKTFQRPATHLNK